jgi:hypothetical protein
VGRKTRKIPSAIARAVLLRDGGCRFPGCTHRRFVHLHHVEHWADGGETKVWNLLTLCSFHHRLLHEDGWQVVYDGTNDPIFYRPNGMRLDATPTPAGAPSDPLAAFETLHAELDIDEETGLTRWDGTPPDYSACVEAVHGLDEGELDMPVTTWLSQRGIA